MTSPISYTYETASAATGLSVSLLKRAVGAGALKARRTGPNGTGRVVILHADLTAWLEGLDEDQAS